MLYANVRCYTDTRNIWPFFFPKENTLLILLLLGKVLSTTCTSFSETVPEAVPQWLVDALISRAADNLGSGTLSDMFISSGTIVRGSRVMPAWSAHSLTAPTVPASTSASTSARTGWDRPRSMAGDDDFANRLSWDHVGDKTKW